MSFRFLRRVGRFDDRHLGARKDEELEAPTPEDEKLQVDVSSSNQAAAVYFDQYPNRWAKIRLAYMLPYYLC
jgi:hypothetical protein